MSILPLGITYGPCGFAASTVNWFDTLIPSLSSKSLKTKTPTLLTTDFDTDFPWQGIDFGLGRLSGGRRPSYR